MKAKRKILISLALLLFAVACSTVAVTGRKQLHLVSDSEIMRMSFQQYDDFLKTHQLSKDQKNTRLVKRVGGKIAAAVEKYLRSKGKYDLVKDYKWEFNLVEDPAVNAWCMPGGKVVVYTGILPYTRDENGLAVVLGHEIAHAVARHGAERMSQEILRNVGAVALAVALDDKSPETRAAWLLAYGIGTQVGEM
jgi:predicted Zn-dependent protease